MIHDLKKCLSWQMILGKYFTPNEMMHGKETKNEMNWFVYNNIQHIYILKAMHPFFILKNFQNSKLIKHHNV